MTQVRVIENTTNLNVDNTFIARPFKSSRAELFEGFEIHFDDIVQYDMRGGMFDKLYNILDELLDENPITSSEQLFNESINGNIMIELTHTDTLGFFCVDYLTITSEYVSETDVIRFKMKQFRPFVSKQDTSAKYAGTRDYRLKTSWKEDFYN